MVDTLLVVEGGLTSFFAYVRSDVDLEPELPNYSDNIDFYKIMGPAFSIISLMCLLSTVSLFRALNQHYHYLENFYLLKSRISPEEVERRRSMRVVNNLQKKREEKGLVTVVESMNETDANRTAMPHNMTLNKTKIHAQTAKDPANIIQEEDPADSEGQGMQLSSRRPQRPQ